MFWIRRDSSPTAQNDKSQFRAISLGCARGGIILEALLAVALVLAGAVLWFGWNQSSDFFRKFSRGDSSSLPAAGDPEKDSAWLQSQVRDILHRHGLGESDVLRTYNREHSDGNVRWVENILEVKITRTFDPSNFRRDIEKSIRRKKLSVLREARENGRLLFELGDSERVFERLVFHMPV